MKTEIATMTERKGIGARIAKIARTLAPAGVEKAFGVTWDGERVWVVDGALGRLVSMDPETGALRDEFPTMHADAGVAHDGRHLWMLAGAEILKLDPDGGRILSRLSVPGGMDCSGLAWAAGALWVGYMRGRRIAKLDPETGEVLREVASDRFVTGVTFADDELWHGAREGEESERDYELRRVDPETGAVLEVLDMPPGVACSGLAADGRRRFFCGDCDTGEVRIVERS
jgi:sugar lactone lactonase YvrE